MLCQLIYRFGVNVANEIEFVSRKVETRYCGARVSQQSSAELAIDHCLAHYTIQLFKTHERTPFRVDLP